MAKGQLDDPFYWNLSDGVTSTVVNPWGQGDSATALRVIHAGDATASVSIVSNTATLDVQLVSGSVASVYVNNPSGQGDTATALRVVHAGDSGASVSILNASLPVTKSGTWAIDNPSGQGDTATALRVVQAGDSATSVSATKVGTWAIDNPSGPGEMATALRVLSAGDSGTSVNIIAGSIANTGFNITGQTEGQGETDARTLRVIHAGDSGVSVNVITALPTGANVIGALSANQSVNNAQVSGNTISVGDGEVGVGTLRVAHAADFGVSVNVITALPTGANVIGALSANQSVNNTQWNANTVSVGDGEVGVGTLRVAHAGDFGVSVNVITALPTGANTIGAVTLSGSLTSAVVVGATLQGAADDGDAPVKFGGIGITANPTAVTGGQRVSARFDKVGRQLITPYQVRDLVGTAYITLATSAGYNTETTLIAAGAAGVFNDIMEVTCTNDSTVAAIFDLRDGTAAGVVKRLMIPANATFEKLFLVPLPQTAAGTNAWTVKNAATGTDTTGTNVTFSAIYIKNV